MAKPSEDDKVIFSAVTVSRIGDYEVVITKPADESSDNWTICQGEEGDDSQQMILLPDEAAVKALIVGLNRLVAGK